MAVSRSGNTGYLSLRDAMNRLLEDSFVSQVGQMASGVVPPVDIYEEQNDYVVCLAIPGADPEKINISAQGGNIAITGEIVKQRQEQKGQAHVQEIAVGRFARTFSLPHDVDSQRADASYENGILTLTLPKAESAKARKIQVKSGHAANQSENVLVQEPGTAGGSQQTSGGSQVTQS